MAPSADRRVICWSHQLIVIIDGRNPFYTQLTVGASSKMNFWFRSLKRTTVQTRIGRVTLNRVLLCVTERAPGRWWWWCAHLPVDKRCTNWIKLFELQTVWLLKKEAFRTLFIIFRQHPTTFWLSVELESHFKTCQSVLFLCMAKTSQTNKPEMWINRRFAPCRFVHN